MLRSSRNLYLALVISLLLLTVATAALPVSPQKINYGLPVKLAEIKDKAISESSGLASSFLNKNCFWTHNDSGDKPRLFLINLAGETVAAVDIKEARLIDWEDMASFRIDKSSYLLIGDVGDNTASHPTSTLYLVREPLINPKLRSIEVVRALTFKYEDGPRNCESIAVDATKKMVYLISKEHRKKCNVYELSLHDKETEDIKTARLIATLKYPQPTAMDISPDGLRCIVLTYRDAYEYTRRKDENWTDAFSRKPRKVKMPRRKQGESICYGQDGWTLYLTSEGRSQPLWKVPTSKKEK